MEDLRVNLSRLHVQIYPDLKIIFNCNEKKFVHLIIKLMFY